MARRKFTSLFLFLALAATLLGVAPAGAQEKHEQPAPEANIGLAANALVVRDGVLFGIALDSGETWMVSDATDVALVTTTTDGSGVAFLSRDADGDDDFIYVANTDGSSSRVLVNEGLDGALSLRFGPNNQWLYFSGRWGKPGEASFQLSRVDVETGVVETLTSPSVRADLLGITEGSVAFFERADASSLVLLDHRTLERRLVYPLQPQMNHLHNNGSLSPDGSAAFFSATTHSSGVTAGILNLTDFTFDVVRSGPAGRMEFSPDGELFVYLTTNGGKQWTVGSTEDRLGSVLVHSEEVVVGPWLSDSSGFLGSKRSEGSSTRAPRDLVHISFDGTVTELGSTGSPVAVTLRTAETLLDVEIVEGAIDAGDVVGDFAETVATPEPAPGDEVIDSESQASESVVPVDDPLDPDTDGDGVRNSRDGDDDNDGVFDTRDVFPLDATETSDVDGDGIGDVADTDDDNDGVLDDEDSYPTDKSRSADPVVERQATLPTVYSYDPAFVPSSRSYESRNTDSILDSRSGRRLVIGLPLAFMLWIVRAVRED